MFLNGALLRRRTQPEVKPGNSYRRQHAKGVTETATVLDLRTDPLGIAHVRFQLRFDRAASEQSETSQRILALPTFRTTYCAQSA